MSDIVKRLRETESRSKRALLDEAAATIEMHRIGCGLLAQENARLREHVEELTEEEEKAIHG